MAEKKSKGGVFILNHLLYFSVQMNVVEALAVITEVKLNQKHLSYCCKCSCYCCLFFYFLFFCQDEDAPTWNCTSCNPPFTAFVEQQCLCQYQVLTGSSMAQLQHLFGQTGSTRIVGLCNQAAGRQTEALPSSWTALKALSAVVPPLCLSPRQISGALNRAQEPICMWESPGPCSDNMTSWLREMEDN